MSPNSITIEKCTSCAKPLPRRGYMRCSSCKSAYDLECANISTKRYHSFYALDKERKCTWKCPECQSKQRNLGSTSTPVQLSTSSTSGAESVSMPDVNNLTLRAKLTQGTNDENLQNGSVLLDCSETSADFKLFLEEMRAVRQEMSMFRATMADLTATIKAQNLRIDGLEARLEFIEAKMSETKNSIYESLEEQISHLNLEIQHRDQEMLANDVEISNFPETSNENSTHIFLTVAKKIGVELQERDVVNAERVGPVRAYVEGGAPPRPRPLAVRLARRESRDALLRAARVRRAITTEGMALPVSNRTFYINERLTKNNRQLFQKAREAARHSNWKYVWTREGKIFARQEQGKARHRLCSDSDIVKVFGDIAVSIKP